MLLTNGVTVTGTSPGKDKGTSISGGSSGWRIFYVPENVESVSDCYVMLINVGTVANVKFQWTGDLDYQFTRLSGFVDRNFQGDVIFDAGLPHPKQYTGGITQYLERLQTAGLLNIGKPYWCAATWPEYKPWAESTVQVISESGTSVGASSGYTAGIRPMIWLNKYVLTSSTKVSDQWGHQAWSIR